MTTTAASPSRASTRASRELPPDIKADLKALNLTPEDFSATSG